MVLNSKMLLSTSRANTNNKPRVAILLAAFNGIDWIEEQINSILNQEDVNIEIFISVDL